MLKRLTAGLALALVAAVAPPASADPQGFIEDELDFGFFYGTFDQQPNVALFSGGPLEQFCDFNDPGTAPLRVFLRNDGTVDLKVNDKHQPIYLYETDFNDIPTWLGAICPGIAEGDAPPQPFATGQADLKVRISVISDDLLEIFNSVNGKAMGTDGTEYKVRGTADLVVENGVPVGDPRDFVGFKLTEIRR
ncbi:hypothetical protein ACFP3Q_01020 [Nocardioides sp. GCM10027113]|uniref:hypothetical protein n=1 Tax=unclassified Nocardioides TaxID=2615069 RepID=UPI0036110300